MGGGGGWVGGGGGLATILTRPNFWDFLSTSCCCSLLSYGKKEVLKI